MRASRHCHVGVSNPPLACLRASAAMAVRLRRPQYGTVQHRYSPRVHPPHPMKLPRSSMPLRGACSGGSDLKPCRGPLVDAALRLHTELQAFLQSALLVAPSISHTDLPLRVLFATLPKPFLRMRSSQLRCTGPAPLLLQPFQTFLRGSIVSSTIVRPMCALSSRSPTRPAVRKEIKKFMQGSPPAILFLGSAISVACSRHLTKLSWLPDSYRQTRIFVKPTHLC